MKDSHGTYDGRKEEPPYDCPTCAALKEKEEEIARLRDTLEEVRLRSWEALK